MSRRTDLAIALLCALMATEAVFLAPLFRDAALTLRQARAQAEGAVPCRDIRCEYTPLVPTIMAMAVGRPVPSSVLVQLVLVACAMLTFRMARTLGNPTQLATRIALVSWALLLANEGRAIVFEPFTLVCLLAAANAFASSPGWDAALRAGLWVGLGFWTKQYALVGWIALLIAGAKIRSLSRTVALTTGVALGVVSGFAVLIALGTEPLSLWSIFETRAYPPSPIGKNLATAPDLLGLLVLSYATLALSGPRPAALPDLRVPFLMSASALLPLYFRGYRHYWQLVIPFLVIILLQPLPSGAASRARAARRGALLLMAISVALDVGRCTRDIITKARQHQRAEAESLKALTNGLARPLYLVDPAVLAWVDAPIIAPREVGPKFDRISRPDVEALLSAADTVVWDTSFAGAGEPLRQAADPATELARRGFVLVRSAGPVRVYSRAPK